MLRFRIGYPATSSLDLKLFFDNLDTIISRVWLRGHITIVTGTSSNMFKPSPKSAEVAHAAAHGGGPFGSGLGEDPLQRVGNTPLVQWETFTGARPTVPILGKAGWSNPAGAVTARAAAN